MENTKYVISASLEGHDKDVRDITFPADDALVSVSRDSTVRLWKRKRDDAEVAYESHINSVGTAYINAIAFLDPAPDYPTGMILSGGADTMIEARSPETKKEEPDYLLLGHAHNVCDLQTFGSTIISASWDGTARVWKNWETQYVLQGHDGAVWAALALSEDEFVTGGADKTVRLWKGDREIKLLTGHTDCVRALCRLPDGLFASCSNDMTIRIWSRDGQQLRELHGHTNYIYSIAALPSGEIVSSGEDRTVRLWKDGSCIQTIAHPAISVWAVAVSPKNGDIATGASDSIVRVFSRDKSRWGSEQVQKAFDESVAGSAIPSAQVESIQKDKIPGPEALERAGTKDGQVIMVKRGDVVEAHMWSAQSQGWTNVGTVVDAAGSGEKKVFDGKEYDFVFDVDIQEGAPPLKLPFNVTENPFDAARRFIENNELPISYIDQVGNFIVKNTQGVSLDQQASSGGADPFGTESRYRPGETSSPSIPRAAKQIPQTQYLSITTANLEPLQRKVNDVNQELVKTGRKDISLNPQELSTLAELCTLLDNFIPGRTKGPQVDAVMGSGLATIFKIITSWPANNRFPALDLLRLLAAVEPLTASYDVNGSGLVETLVGSGVLDKSSPINVMLSLRTFVNLFQTEAGRVYLAVNFEKILPQVKDQAVNSTNRNLKIALATLLLNYAVLIRTEKASEKAVTLLEPVVALVAAEPDAETTYRAMVALGTVTILGGAVKEAAKVLDARSAVKKAAGRIDEARIKTIAEEINGLL